MLAIVGFFVIARFTFSQRQHTMHQWNRTKDQFHCIKALPAWLCINKRAACRTTAPLYGEPQLNPAYNSQINMIFLSQQRSFDLTVVSSVLLVMLLEVILLCSTLLPLETDGTHAYSVYHKIYQRFWCCLFDHGHIMRRYAQSFGKICFIVVISVDMCDPFNLYLSGLQHTICMLTKLKNPIKIYNLTLTILSHESQCMTHCHVLTIRQNFRERERLSLSAFLRTEDIGVHIVHISRLIITYTLE